MNRKRIIFTCLVMFQIMRLFGQSVAFSYDVNGNRTSRTIIVEQLRSDSVKFPITDPKNLKSIGNLNAKSLVAGESNKTADSKGKVDAFRETINPETNEIAANIYPNPNKGLIKIDITNMPLTSENEMRFYDLNGNELTIRRNFDSHSEIDISQYKDGTYILRIKIKDKRFDFKIIKVQTAGN